MYMVAETRESYKTFRVAVTIVHYAVVLVAMPYVTRFLYLKSKETADDNDIEALVTTLASSSVLVCSVILAHLN